MDVSEACSERPVYGFEVEVAPRNLASRSPVRTCAANLLKFRFAQSAFAGAVAYEPALLRPFHCTKLRVTAPEAVVFLAEVRRPRFRKRDSNMVGYGVP